MIKSVDKSNFNDFKLACTIEPIFGSKCLASYLAYESGAYVQYNHLNNPALAGYLANNVLVISSDNTCESKPLCQFIKENNIKEIDTNLNQSLALKEALGGNIESSFYMTYNAGAFSDDFTDIVPAASLKDVFDILQKSHEYYRTHLNYDIWSSDISLRCSKELMEIYIIYKNGLPIATGSIISWDDTCGVVAAVAVIPEWRHNKLGTHMSKFLTNRILSLGKTPKLISGYDEVSALYKSIGYEITSRFGELYL